MKIQVIVPAHQAEETLSACLEGVKVAGFDLSDVILVDDGSRDRTAAIAHEYGVRVISNAEALRPAKARNRGVEEAEADILLFVDADVVLRAGIRDRLLHHFADPGVTAVIGSYDDQPGGGTVVSDYRNLLHHYTHQVSPGESETFWTGLGAVRRQAFLDAGGFRSEWENIEDVEFGLRLREGGGRILLDPSLQGRHLKVWTPGSMFRTDLHGRAVPWTRLLRLGRARTGKLNTSLSNRVAAFGVALAALGLLLLPFLGLGGLLLLLGAALFLGASWPFLSHLWRIRGPGFALRAVPYHALHYVAALAGYARVRLERGTSPA
ncbi:MAG: glycosyltransferase [Pseudomonadota bacterium]